MIDFYKILLYVLFYLGLTSFIFYLFTIFSGSKSGEVSSSRKDKFISIIIPAYNEEKSIKSTIESALKIDYPLENFEIIVVDDGSTDRTFEMVNKISSSNLRVFTKSNGGKGNAINYGLSKARGEIIFTMDADTFVEPDAVKKMVSSFDDPLVMCSCPSMLVHNPKSFLQKISFAEYYLGIFIRKAFSKIDSIHVTPGAFSAYRKKFFDDYGGFDENNITEDMEVALRIQSNDFRIDNVPDAKIYTIAPKKFKTLLLQRRRWYVGMVRNLWSYRDFFGPKKGIMGIFVLPMALISVILGVFLTCYSLLKSLINLYDNYVLLRSVNFSFQGIFEVSDFFFENLIYSLFSNLLFLLGILSFITLWFIIYYSRKKSKYNLSVGVSIFFYILFYFPLFSFWWIVSLFYIVLNKEIGWGGNAVK